MIVIAAFYSCVLLCRAHAQDSPRERILLDKDWRFTHGDPPGADSSLLLYDVRPVATGEDQKAHAAEATAEAAQLASAPHSVLKPWILPSGNRFLKDPAKCFTRPAGNPGSDLAYVQSTFDDHAWRSIDLPYDWAIEGPFNSEHVGGSMGRLPSPGIGWYLTPYLNFGADNQLAIRLDNPPDFSRWYPGASIYRHVWLPKTEPIHVAQFGTDVTTTDVSETSARIHLNVNVDNDSHRSSIVTVTTSIYTLDENGHATGHSVASMPSTHVTVPAQPHAESEVSTVLSRPQLWGPLFLCSGLIDTSLSPQSRMAKRSSIATKRPSASANSSAYRTGSMSTASMSESRV